MSPPVGIVGGGGSTPSVRGNTFNVGTRGTGGTSLGNNGQNGVEADVHSP